MEFSNIRPFVRYVHYLPVDIQSNYSENIPCDNRLFFSYYGNGKISSDGTVYNMKKGSLLIIPAGTKYQILSNDDAATYIAANFDYTYQNSNKNVPIPPVSVSGYNANMRLENPYFSDMPQFNNTVYIENQFHLENALLKIYDEFTAKKIFCSPILSNLFAEVLLSCARAMYTNTYKENSETINLILDYINENYSKKITNNTIGNKFNLHPNYISAVVKKHTGIPMHQYVMQKRISAALSMLMTKKYSVGEISEKCGFSDIYHFSKTFKKITGISPSEYH